MKAKVAFTDKSTLCSAKQKKGGTMRVGRPASGPASLTAPRMARPNKEQCHAMDTKKPPKIKKGRCVRLRFELPSPVADFAATKE